MTFDAAWVGIDLPSHVVSLGAGTRFVFVVKGDSRPTIFGAIWSHEVIIKHCF